MNDRRRNLLVLLLVAGLLAGSAAIVVIKATRLGLDLKGGVELVYQGKPTKQSKVTPDSLNRAIDIMRERVDSLGVSEPEINTVGSGQIQVSLPGSKDLNQAIRVVGTTAQLYFYDWEPNVIGPNGKTQPNNAEVTGGPSAGNAGAVSHYEAVIEAAKRPAENPKTATTNGSYYYVNDKTKTVLGDVGDVSGGGEEDLQDLKDALRAARISTVGARLVKVQAGTIVVRAQSVDGKAKNDQYYALNDNPALSGTDIKDPQQTYDNGAGGSGQPIVTFNFTGKGKKIWQKTTRTIAQRGQANQIPGQDAQASAQHFAIVLDDELISVPFIDFRQNPDGIDASNGSQIEGGFTIDSAQRLANLIKNGALPIKLDLISQSQVSATLGKQALNQGLIAGLAGFVIVALFLLTFYRFLGLIAVGGLLVYSIYFFALIKLIPITLTLPGIAGLVLTIGVAADANIVIFERVKEEVRAGRSIPSAIATGYKRGLAAIIDANVVTFMTAFILFVLATAGVKGFAFVLGIGTLVSLFTAVLLTQAILATLSRTRMLSSPSALGAGEKHRRRITFDFMGASKWFFSFSGVILLIGALAIGGKGIHFGIDFESGTRITTALTQKTDVGGVRDVLASEGYGDAEIQKVSNKKLGDNAYQIQGKIPVNKVITLQRALNAKFGGTPNFSSDSVGPTFGRTVAKSAIIAIIASLLVISVYIALRFEWKYAVPVLIALMHDLLITSGVYSLTGREVSTSTVAALLTILGYSLYDTIIVFDRIRENVPRMPRAAFSQIVNRSMSEVVVRSMATSFCTLLPVLALLLFGGDTLKDFAFALLVGVASGAYSSVFIAAPVLTLWKEREPVYETRARRIISELGSVPAYATAGAAVDVDPQRKATRRTGRLTQPDAPGEQLSKREFDALVQDLPTDESGLATRRDRGGAPDDVQPVAAPAPSSADALPEDVVMPKPERTKARRPRNSKHGRPR